MLTVYTFIYILIPPAPHVRLYGLMTFVVEGADARIVPGRYSLSALSTVDFEPTSFLVWNNKVGKQC